MGLNSNSGEWEHFCLAFLAISPYLAVFDKSTIGGEATNNKSIKTIQKSQSDKIFRYKMPKGGENYF